MGSHAHAAPIDRDYLIREYNAKAAEKLQEQQDKRMKLAAKIAMMIGKTVEDKLIRPGPVAEERECYDMAQELRDMLPELTDLVSAILKTEGVVP